MSFQQQIQASYEEAFGHPPSGAELVYWSNFFAQPAQIVHYAAEPGRVYPDLIQWHKDYMGKAEGKTTRIDVIRKSYLDSSLKELPSEQELNYWLGQPVYTYQQLRQYHEDYLGELALVEEQIQSSYREAFGKAPSVDEDRFWHARLDASGSLTHYKDLGAAQRYADLITWHKKYMATAEGRLARIDVIRKSYQDSLLHKDPTQAEIDYWLTQDAHTYKELKQYHDSYVKSAKPAKLTLRYKWRTSPLGGNQGDHFTEIVRFEGMWTKGKGVDGASTFTLPGTSMAQKGGFDQVVTAAQEDLKQGTWSITATVIGGEGPSPFTCTVDVPGALTFDTTSAFGVCKLL